VIFLLTIVKPLFFPNFFKTKFQTEEAKKNFMIEELTMKEKVYKKNSKK
jgi:hypothetical protein